MPYSPRIELDDAIDEYKKAIDLDPKSGLPYFTSATRCYGRAVLPRLKRHSKRCCELLSTSDPRCEAIKQRIEQARRFLRFRQQAAFDPIWGKDINRYW